MAGNPRKGRLDLAEELYCIALDRGGRVARKRRANVTSRIVHQDSGVTGLCARHLPSILVTGIGIAGTRANAPRSRLVPVTVSELEMELGIGCVTKLLDTGY